MINGAMNGQSEQVILVVQNMKSQHLVDLKHLNRHRSIFFLH